MNNKFIIIICVAVLCCCCTKKSSGYKSDYNIEIIYDFNDSTRINFNSLSKFPKDSIHLYFEYRFDYDTVSIYKNGNLFLNEVIKTSAITALGKYICLGNINDFESFGIRVNNGKMAFIEIDSDVKRPVVVGVKYMDRNLQVLFYKETPVFR